jgi:hypothetical protein
VDEEESEDERPRAWNPFTPSGVASFANAPLGHLLTVELVTALLVFLATALYLDRSWATAIDRAVEGFPPGSRIHAGEVDLPGTEALRLSTNHLVGITWSRVDAPGSASDVELHLHPDEWKLSTLFGYVNLPYPPGISQPLNRETLSPRWGAWRSGLLPLAAMAYTTGIVVAWFVLAAVYSWPIRVFTFFRDKHTSRLGCWKLCAAALLPGAFLMAAATVFYTLGQIPVVGVAVAFIAHIVLGWAYVLCGAVALPLIPETEQLQGNPFRREPGKKRAKPGKNPFKK